MKRPAFQFYPADWQKDANLQACSLAARGLWIEMMCIAHQCDPYAHLALSGQAMTEAQLARLVGATPGEVKRLLAELEKACVFGRAPKDGAIYSRRMLRDEQLRNARAEGGKDGAEHGIKGKEFGKEGGRPRKDKGAEKPPLKPAPSSSSSSSEKSKVAFAPPDWVPLTAWTAWLEVRKKKRAPNTEEALRLAVVELEKLRAAGHAPEAVLNQSTFRGWQGLFELKPGITSAPELPAIAKAESCPCGEPGNVKVGGKWRCGAHVRFDFSTAAKAA